MEEKQYGVLTKKMIREQIELNLLERGTFFASQTITERPYVVREDSEMLPVTNDDYMRVMLYGRDGETDPRWVGEDYLPPDARIKQDALGVLLSDLPKITIYPAVQVEGLRPYRPLDMSDRYTLSDLKEYHLKNAHALMDAYFTSKNVDIVKELPIEERIRRAADMMLNDIDGSPEQKAVDKEALVHLIKTEYQLPLSAKVENAKQIAELIKSDEDLIFASFNRAEEIIENLNFLELQQRVKKGIANRDKIEEPFQNLKIEFEFSEAILKNPLTGKEFGNDTILHGEEAYLFLVALNNHDKKESMEQWGYDKTYFTFHYEYFNYGDMRVDLGAMELKNATTIAEAMKRRCSLRYNNILKSPSKRLNVIELKKTAYGNVITEDMLLQTAKNKLEQIGKSFDKFCEEETRYLKRHPEIEKINQEQCETYLYHCYTAKRVEDVPYHWNYISAKETDEAGVVVESKLNYDSNTLNRRQMKPFYTQEQRKQLEQLENLSFTWEITTGNFRTVTGGEAMKAILGMICNDKRLYRSIALSRKVGKYYKEDIEIKFLNYECKKKFVYGRLSLGNQSSITDSLRFIGNPLTQAQKESLDQLEKIEPIYLKYQDRKIKNTLKYPVEVVPDLIVYPFMEKPKKGARYNNVFDYYKNFVEINQSDPTVDHELSTLIPSIIKAMQEDGRTKSQIIHALEAGGIKKARETVNQLVPKTERKRKL